MTATAASPTVAPGDENGWVRVCTLAQLDRERGVAALVGDRQIALFRTFDDELFALDNQDPFSGAMVMSRGIVGTRVGVPTVASPMYKQVFDLRTGQCFDEAAVSIGTYPVRLVEGWLEVNVFGKFGGSHNPAD
jgi:nitrite reductase (NADH) small subunit